MKWLKKEFRTGKVNWAHSEHSFAIGVTGSYGYALYCSEFAKEKQMKIAILNHLARIQRQDGFFNRFEKGKVPETIEGVMLELFEWQSISPKEFGLSTRLLRIRRRLARDMKERRKLQISLYYSTQILDCLAESIIHEGENHEGQDSFFKRSA